MNEQIEKLFDQALEEFKVENKYAIVVVPDLLQREFVEKFAKLIVRECVQTLRDNTPVVDEHDSVEEWDRGYIRAIGDCEHHIQEHFGIEE